MKDRKTSFLKEEAPLLEMPAVIWLIIIAFAFVLGCGLLVFPWWLVLFIFCVMCIAIIVFINPIFGVIVFLFGAFFHPTQHFSQLQQFNLAQNLAIGVLLVWIFRTIVYRDFDFVKSRENFFITLYLALVFVSGTINWSFSSSVAIQQTIKVMVLYLVIVNMVKTRRQSLIIIWTIVLLATIAGFMGIYQYVFNIGRHYMNGGRVRVIGPERDPNFFAMHLVVVLPIAINLIWTQRRKLMKIVLIVISALLLVNILFTYSRTAMVALAAVLFLLAVRPLFQKPKRKLPLVCLILAVILFLPFIPSDYWLRAKTIVSSEADASIRGRLEALRAGIEMVREHPIRGVGFGLFKYEYLKHAVSSYVFQIPLTAHNMYITIAAESGMPALVVFLLVVFCALRELKEARQVFQKRKDVLLVDISNALEIGIIGFLFGGLFLSQSYLLIFWMVIAFSIAMKQISLDNSSLSYTMNSHKEKKVING